MEIKWEILATLVILVALQVNCSELPDRECCDDLISSEVIPEHRAPPDLSVEFLPEFRPEVSAETGGGGGGDSDSGTGGGSNFASLDTNFFPEFIPELNSNIGYPHHYDVDNAVQTTTGRTETIMATQPILKSTETVKGMINRYKDSFTWIL